MSVQQEDFYKWQKATVVGLPAESDIQANSKKTVSQNAMVEESWHITRRDMPLPSATAIKVMDHAHVVLEKRLSESNQALDVLKFETTLARFLNSEIELGNKIAFGNFADIYTIHRLRNHGSTSKACTPEQTQAAEAIRRNVGADELVIKVLRPSLLANTMLYATGAADILTEGTILAGLDHPHIVKVWGRSVASVEGFATGKRDSFFLVLERLECTLLDRIEDWQERVSTRRLLSHGLRASKQYHERVMSERLELMAQLADGLAYLHSKHIIHRDLKLSNIGIDQLGRVKLIDFGLAKVLPPHNIEKDMFNMTGNTGSVRYMAPEIARSEPYNLKADVYSFSIVFYEVLNLQKAWLGLKPQEIRRKVLVRKQRPQPSLFWPYEIREILKGAWSDEPSARLSMSHVHSVLLKQLMLMPAA